MLPIGVVIPTRNAASLLPQHLAALREWIDHAQEVVVVDSFSKDGTMEMIRAELRHPRLRLFEHPPGLYQSWNYGIQQLRAEYCYVSTVGETITIEGLRHLADVMSRGRCDVVVSRPEFVDLQGQPMRPPRWPIDDMLHSLAVTEPVVLWGARLFLFTLANYREAILGSSASNLYRTRCLQENPFPVDYGTAGDGGWGLAHCSRIRLGLTPRSFSTFREHPKSYSRAEYAVDQMGKKMFDRICLTYREALAANPEFAGLAKELQVDRLIELLDRQRGFQETLEQCRHARIPWVFQPAAWQARKQRDAEAQEVARLKEQALGLLRAKDAGPERLS